MARWFGVLSPSELQQFIGPDRAAHKTGSANSLAPRRATCIYVESGTSWLPDSLLKHGNRMAMTASLKARMPFVGHLLGLLNHYRAHGTHTQWILCEAMKWLLSASICQWPKVGFRVPGNEWFRTTMRDYRYDHLIGPRFLTGDYYSRNSLVERVNPRKMVTGTTEP